jgi:signal transduction histidine kinase
MSALLEKLPTILVLAVLVGIFLALCRRTRSNTINLWTGAWFLIFIHFFVQLFETNSGTSLADIVDILSLALSAVVFIVSMTRYAEKTWRALALVALFAAPLTLQSVVDVRQWEQRSLRLACAVAIFGGAMLVSGLKYRRAWLGRAALAGVLGRSLYGIGHGHYDFVMLAILSLGFAWSGVLYWHIFRRRTAGVLTTAGGFLCWGAVFPAGWLADTYWHNLQINPELWNVPKFFVAFGMILTLLEEKSHAVEKAAERERAVNEQLERFAHLTSQLLSGMELKKVCGEIAAAIVETTTFQRAAVLLANDDKTLYVAGSRGFGAEAERKLEQMAPEWNTTQLGELCHKGTAIGRNSYQLERELAGPLAAVANERPCGDDSHWRAGEKIFVPLLSPRGVYVGNISLDEPCDPARVAHDEISKVELLATDLAVTVENNCLQRQLIRSEKLAALGQLVAGVAHEINNPLTAVIGYCELMADQSLPSSAAQMREKLSREALRMKRIVDNLLRFASPRKVGCKVCSLESIVQEVISLREYHLQVRGVKTETHIEPDLPHFDMEEDQFKQILLNLLNNAVDAVEGTRDKRILIEAKRREDRVLVRFQDSGPGFIDPQRAFDPFYTTKPVGKGTGLGLSICYGIVREHGGDIHAHNLSPNGAVVSIELPISASRTEPEQGEPVLVGASQEYWRRSPGDSMTKER